MGDKQVRIASLGHVVFAAVMIGVGLVGLVNTNLAPVWQPIPKSLPARTALIYLCVLISLASGIGMLVKSTATIASRTLLAYLLVWFIVFRLPNIVFAPARQNTWSGLGETAVVIAGAWVLYAWFASNWDKNQFGFATGDAGVRIARVFYGLALIPFGVAHFTYLKETVDLVPSWLPAHLAFAYFTGGAYIVAGLAVIFGVYGRLAATLSALQMALFNLLVWLPIMTANPDGSQRTEFFVSLALMAGGWVVADSYRGTHWLAMSKRTT